jgi:hypothetical protein
MRLGIRQGLCCRTFTKLFSRNGLGLVADSPEKDDMHFIDWIIPPSKRVGDTVAVLILG